MTLETFLVDLTDVNEYRDWLFDWYSAVSKHAWPEFQWKNDVTKITHYLITVFQHHRRAKTGSALVIKFHGGCSAFKNWFRNIFDKKKNINAPVNMIQHIQ